MDYWIRLNKAIDVANECLRRRNKRDEDPVAEAVMMFVSHCPDLSLALSLQFKPAEQWSATEIQERLDCHRRNMKRDSARSPRYTPGSACHQNTVTVCDDPVTSFTKQPKLSSGQSQYSDAQLNPNAAPFSPNTNVQHLVAMMDKVLSLCTASLSLSNTACPKRSSDFKSNVSQACRVCQSKEHTTYTHCMRQRLCRNCLKPGHFKSSCPMAANLEQPSPSTQLN
ncbi:hypothetical protein C0J50_11211 [Silurus asotus]|uniref:CCHC-type domain-containing protein n=1 Tax=Silurus asotus TaxID=30991 RepID=A0AAD5AC10_SILAS|nr:hypothetical protein C0J50_11211 [Silurus asotus]